MTIIDQVTGALTKIEGIDQVKLIADDLKNQILEIEKSHENHMKTMFADCINQGVRDVLARKIVIAIMHNPQLRHPPGPTVVLSLHDEIIGEEVWEVDTIKAMKKRSDVLFISEDFVIYKEKIRETPSGKPEFLFPGLPFPELDIINGVNDVISASPIASTDVDIRRSMGWNEEDPNLGTVLIGFNIF
jgi:hypothetical protein